MNKYTIQDVIDHTTSQIPEPLSTAVVNFINDISQGTEIFCFLEDYNIKPLLPLPQNNNETYNGSFIIGGEPVISFNVFFIDKMTTVRFAFSYKEGWEYETRISYGAILEADKIVHLQESERKKLINALMTLKL